MSELFESRALLAQYRREEIEARKVACQCRRTGGHTAQWEQRVAELKAARQMVERSLGRADEVPLE